MQFWSEIIVVISNRARAVSSFHFEEGYFKWSFSEGEGRVVGVDYRSKLNSGLIFFNLHV